jgi:hypothetical protein
MPFNPRGVTAFFARLLGTDADVMVRLMIVIARPVPGAQRESIYWRFHFDHGNGMPTGGAEDGDGVLALVRRKRCAYSMRRGVSVADVRVWVKHHPTHPASDRLSGWRKNWIVMPSGTV